MHDSLTFDTCVGIRKDCPVRYLVTADSQTEFSFGGPCDGFNLAFEPAALRAFLQLGIEALAKAEAQRPEYR